MKSTILLFSIASAAVTSAGTFAISTTAPDANVLESFNTLDYTNTTAVLGTMGPARKQLGTVNGDNRMAGQRLTLSQSTNVQASSITFRVASSKSFSGGGDVNTLLLSIVDASHAQIASYSYDLSSTDFVKGDYVKLDLNNVELASTTTGVEYEFQLYFGETDTENALALERDNGGNSYADGALISMASTTDVLSLPIASPSGGNSDLTFFLEGNVIPEPATLGLISAFGGGVFLIRRWFSI
ncbi:hypothetical protein PDESU_04950 [Pontiella desulfatans]|uniref:PEP-CTERM protein-sorting domain-containing protein n=1 Tax=Pontiella desulfatans TaxID=2750659 RepID=A0A6C2U8Z5_PONDE|nr:PEP-CTERM sorting domain-containing protein [Pontiella desulfatans]VGO16359.1 hypothetical protein PDESU_04950 [Pontiella desulfatans]